MAYDQRLADVEDELARVREAGRRMAVASDDLQSVLLAGTGDQIEEAYDELWEALAGWRAASGTEEHE